MISVRAPLAKSNRDQPVRGLLEHRTEYEGWIMDLGGGT